MTPKPAKGPDFRQITDINETHFGYPVAQLACRPEEELLSLRQCDAVWAPQPMQLPLCLPAQQFTLLRLETETTGMLCIAGYAKSSGTIYLSFDEILSPEKTVDFLRMQCTNVVTLRVQAGAFRFETIEPYSMQYLTVTTTAPVTVETLCLREYAGCSADAAAFTCPDQELESVFAAARNTFRQNVVDNYMDCPSRERAGWL